MIQMEYVLNKKYSNYDIGEIFDENGQIEECVNYLKCNDDIIGKYPNCLKLSTEMYELKKRRYHKKLCKFLYEVNENDECSSIIERDYENGDEEKLLIVKRDGKYITIKHEIRFTYGREELLFVSEHNNLKDVRNIFHN